MSLWSLCLSFSLIAVINESLKASMLQYFSRSVISMGQNLLIIYCLYGDEGKPCSNVTNISPSLLVLAEIMHRNWG